MPEKLIDLLTASLLEAAAKGDNEAFAGVKKLLENPSRLTKAYSDAKGDVDKMFELLKG